MRGLKEEVVIGGSVGGVVGEEERCWMCEAGGCGVDGCC